MKGKHSSHPDTPISAATAAKVCAALNLSEREGQAMLSLSPVSDEEVAAALRVNIHALGAAFSESTVAAITADKKLDLPVTSQELVDDSEHVRVLAGASDKLRVLDGELHAAARVEASALQRVESKLLPQLRARAAVDAKLRDTFAALFAYHHAKNPGHHGHAAAEPPPPPPK